MKILLIISYALIQLIISGVISLACAQVAPDTIAIQKNHLYKLDLHTAIRSFVEKDIWLTVSRETPFQDKRWTSSLVFEYLNGAYTTSLNGQTVSASESTSIFFRPQVRRYWRKNKSKTFQGFYTAISPFYNYADLYNHQETQHNAGIAPVVGYQQTFGKRWAAELGFFWGFTGSWYKYQDKTTRETIEGFEYKNILRLDLNIGFRL